MKKKFLYALTAILALGFTACKDDDENMRPTNPAEDFDRMPMTMFRLEENTNVSNDPYGTRVITDERNTVELAWYGVDGAAGYEIAYGLMPPLTNPSGWDDENNLAVWPDGKRTHVVPADQLTLRIENLEYGTDYRFAIRVLHPDGKEEHHSHWYGHGDGRQWAEYCGLKTEDRYTTPGIVNVGNISEDRTEFTVYIDINVASALVDATAGLNKPTEDEIKAAKEAMFKELKENFEFVQDGNQDDMEKAKFKVDRLTVLPSSETPGVSVNPKWMDYELTADDFVDGKAELRIDQLQPNAIYLVNVINSNIPVPVDARYNTIRKPVYGDPGEPITIEHTVRATDSIPGEVEYNACYLDKIIGDFATNIKLAEGQTFYLRGGCAYYFFSNPNINKGFTLETHPDDVAQGKRAKVYMGGIGVGLDADGNRTAELATCNFMFGKQKAAGEADCPIEVGSVIFRNIDFDCPGAYNYGHEQEKIAKASGNYFANMYSNGMEVSFKSFEVYNCTFQRMVRGFFRVQGSKDKFFEKIVIDGNLFYNCGYYDNNGRGYAWFAGDGGRVSSNIYKNFSWTNNTMYDSPRTAMISDNDKNINYNPEIQWNIKIEGNTFINYSTRSKDRCFFQTRYVPSGSHYTFKRNLIVLAADDNDKRSLLQCGADIREIKGDGLFSFDVADNYSVGARDAQLADDKIFSGRQFSRTSQSFGATNWNPGNVGSKEDLVVKALTDDNGKAMKATDLFNNPNPPYTAHDPAVANHRDHEAPADIFNALKYKTIPSIILEKNIGDPRWR